MGEVKIDFLEPVNSSVCHELRIPVPWGHIAAKSWNDPCGSPVLAVHGLQDNAGTFDRLIPLLPKAFYFVSVDLPGHGRSSHFPSGVPLNFLDCVTTIKRIVDHLGWTKFMYLGHSLGGQMGAFFAAMFPDYVSKLIMLDSVTAPIMQPGTLLKRHLLLHKKVIGLEEKVKSGKTPAYTYDEALRRLVEHRPFKLTEEAAKALIIRSLEAFPDGYHFTTDQRLKSGLLPMMYLAQHLEMVEKITCPYLIIFAKESWNYFNSSQAKHVIEAHKQKPNFSHVIVEGNHDVHNNYPDRVVPIITEYFSYTKCSL